jgi:hypothetical protein
VAAARAGLVGRQVGGELLVEQLLADVEVGGAVGRGTGEIGLAERAAGEAPGQLADALLVLRGEGRDEDERLDRGLSLAAALITAPPYECPTRTTGPSTESRTAFTWAASPDRLRSGLATAIVWCPAACSRAMTPFQLADSAKAPWTRTTVDWDMRCSSGRGGTRSGAPATTCGRRWLVVTARTSWRAYGPTSHGRTRSVARC